MTRRSRMRAWWRTTFRRRRVPGRQTRRIPWDMDLDDPRLVERDDTPVWGGSSSFDK